LWRLDGDNLAASADKTKSRRDEGQLGDRALEVLALVNSPTETRAADLSVLNINQEHGPVYLNRLANSGRIRKLGRGVCGSAKYVDPDQMTFDQEPGSTTVTTVTTINHRQVKDTADEEVNVTPPDVSVTSEEDGPPTPPEFGNLTDITPMHRTGADGPVEWPSREEWDKRTRHR